MYYLIKFLLKITLKVFFRKKTINGLENLPKEGPVLLLANHPSTFLDPIIVAVYSKRPVYFLSKSTVFVNPVVKWFFKQLHMIPVYRKQDNPAEMHKNQDTFLKCYEHFDNDGVLLMFPEGISITEKKIKPIKTGAARIAVGAGERNNFKTNVQIVCIGLDYENPHQFKKNFTMNIGEPFLAKDYYDESAKSNSNPVKVITQNIKEQLEYLSVHLSDQRQEELLAQLPQVFPHNESKSFSFQKRAAQIIEYYATHKMVNFHFLSLRINNFIKSKYELGLQEEHKIVKSKPQFVGKGVLQIIGLIVGFPLFLFGYFIHAIPYYLAPWLTVKITEEIEYRGPISMVLGMFMYLFSYIAMSVLLFSFTPIPLAIATIVILPISGLFAYEYIQFVKEIKISNKLKRLFFNQGHEVSQLIVEQKALQTELMKIHEEFDAISISK